MINKSSAYITLFIYIYIYLPFITITTINYYTPILIIIFYTYFNGVQLQIKKEKKKVYYYIALHYLRLYMLRGGGQLFFF